MNIKKNFFIKIKNIKYYLFGKINDDKTIEILELLQNSECYLSLKKIKEKVSFGKNKITFNRIFSFCVDEDINYYTTMTKEELEDEDNYKVGKESLLIPTQPWEELVMDFDDFRPDFTISNKGILYLKNNENLIRQRKHDMWILILTIGLITATILNIFF